MIIAGLLTGGGVIGCRAYSVELAMQDMSAAERRGACRCGGGAADASLRGFTETELIVATSIARVCRKLLKSLQRTRQSID